MIASADIRILEFGFIVFAVLIGLIHVINNHVHNIHYGVPPVFSH